MELQEQKQVFSSVPDISAWYPTESVRTAGDAVYHCLEQGEGIALIFGETGMGKTLLLQDMAELFDRDDAVVFPLSRIDTAKSLLQQILHGLHQTWCGCSENEMRLMLRDYFQQTQYQRVIILLDDAQSYRFSVFEEIRSLLDHWSNRGCLVRVAMAGTPQLEERLTHPKLQPFLQRVVTRVWLESFTSEETVSYLDRETGRMNSDVKLYSFTKEAMDAIYRFSQGVPRRINQIARQTVFHSIPSDETPLVIDEESVKRAWSELQQIPFTILNNGSNETQLNSANNESANNDSRGSDSVNSNSINSDSVVEFGTLLDDDNTDHDRITTEDRISADNISADNNMFTGITETIEFPLCENAGENPVENGVDNSSAVEINDITDDVLEDDMSAEETLSRRESNEDINEESEEENEESEEKAKTNDLRIFRFDLNPTVQGAVILDNEQNDSFNDTSSVQNSANMNTSDFEEPSLSELAARSDRPDNSVRLTNSAREKQTANVSNSSKNQGITESEQKIGRREEYLDELVRLEEEVSMEARIIRQIREMHSQLRNAHSTAFERAQVQAEELKSAGSDKGSDTVRSVFRQIYKDE